MSLVYKLNRLYRVLKPDVVVVPLPEDIGVEIDIAIPMRDGQTLRANLFRAAASGPAKDEPRPVIMSAHPYSKDIVPKAGWICNSVPIQFRVMRMVSTVTMSEGTSWEAPDPLFWVKQGYNVVNMDFRGYYKSEAAGKTTIISDQEAEDYYDAIEWIAKQQWCSGKVGLCGVSYLAISQYKVAALNPPHLAAFCPWEGLSDCYKDMAYPGGVQEIGFSRMWFTGVQNHTNENLRELVDKNETRNHPFFLSKSPNLKAVKVPALVCMSYSDQGLHTNGSFRVFREISSEHKWLWTHRDGKWSAFYSDQATAMQLQFFDYFLKDKKDNGLMDVPRIRLEVRDRGDHIHSVLNFREPVFPVKTTKWQELVLKGDSTMAFKTEAGAVEISKVPFHLLSGCASFRYQFEDDVIISGPMKATFLLSSATATDANLFIFARKFDLQGNEVVFEGGAGWANDVVAKGWQRLALRKPYDHYQEPWDADKPFDEIQPLTLNVPVPVTVQLLPSATFFEKGSSLTLEVRGKWTLPTFPVFQVFNYEPSKEDAEFNIHCGEIDGKPDLCSNLVIGILPNGSV